MSAVCVTEVSLHLTCLYLWANRMLGKNQSSSNDFIDFLLRTCIDSPKDLILDILCNLFSHFLQILGKYILIYCLPDLKYTCQHVEVYWISWVIGAVSTTIDRIKTATVVIKIWNVFIFHRLAKKKNWIQSNRTWKRDSWDLLTIAFHIMATSGTMVHFLR